MGALIKQIFRVFFILLFFYILLFVFLSFFVLAMTLLACFLLMSLITLLASFASLFFKQPNSDVTGNE